MGTLEVIVLGRTEALLGQPPGSKGRVHIAGHLNHPHDAEDVLNQTLIYYTVLTK